MLLIQLQNAACPSTYLEIYEKDTRKIDVNRGAYCNRLVYEGEARSVPALINTRRIERLGAMPNRYGNSCIVVNLE